MTTGTMLGFVVGVTVGLLATPIWRSLWGLWWLLPRHETIPISEERRQIWNRQERGRT